MSQKTAEMEGIGGARGRSFVGGAGGSPLGFRVLVGRRGGGGGTSGPRFIREPDKAEKRGSCGRF